MRKERALPVAQRLGPLMGVIFVGWWGFGDDAAAAADAVFVEQSVPTTDMQTEEKNYVSITMRNAGTETWRSTDDYCLEAQDATKNWKWGVLYNLVPGRVCLDDDETIAPNQSKTFSFHVHAPPSVGAYNFQWQMTQSGAAFGAMTPPVAISVFQPTYKVVSIRQLKPTGGRVDWSQSGNDLIAYDRQSRDAYDYASPDGCYDVWTMGPDGSNDRCLTCEAPRFDNRHLGNPAWHPSGNYIVFQAEKDHLGWCSHFSKPGLGDANELWVMTPDGQSFRQLTQVAGPNGAGVLHPHFSHDGRMLSWSEMYEAAGAGEGQSFGYWKLKVADFVDGAAGPELVNERVYLPDLEGMYENHGFSPDGTKLLFSTNVKVGESAYASESRQNIYSLDLATGATKALTIDEGFHNEHATYSPDGQQILWMTGTDNFNQGTDFWVMKSDGSAKRRVTNFNRPGYPEYTGSFGKVMTAADSSWSPDGLRFVGYVQNDLITQDGEIHVVEFTRTAEPPIAPPERLYLRQSYE
jgi:Tol biopolymer transport system component